MAKKIESIERILMIRLSALGDCMVSIPVLMALRSRFPNAHIAWAIQDNFAPFIRHVPGIDEVIIFPRQRWRACSSKIQILREAKEFIRHIKMRRFDVTVDVQSNTKSSGIAFFSRAPVRIGHGPDEDKEISAWLNNKLISPEPGMDHIVERNVNLLRALGIEGIEPTFSLPSDPIAQKRIKNWLAAKSLNEGAYCLLIPYCGKENKEWKPEYFTDLAQALSHDGKKTVFLCAPGREKEIQGLIPESCEQSVFLGPRTSILEMVELVRLSGVCVGGDTGPIQIAGGIGVASVALFGPTSAKRSKPWRAGIIHSLEYSPDDVHESVRKIIT